MKDHTISNSQRSILYGTLLGDSSLSSRKGIIQLEQGCENKDYLFWLFEKLKNLTTGKSPSLVTRFDKRTKSYTQSFRFYTRALFHDWRHQFYSENGVKKLPENFQKDLNATALAVWFLDDGGRSSGVKAGVFLTVDKYTPTEIQSIQYTLQTVFGLHTRLHRSGQSRSGYPQKRLSFTGEN